MDYRSLYWEDVEEGQALPAYTYELSLLRLVAMVRASGLYDYVHFDRDYARAVGARDAFIATHHVAGLFSRLLTDWSGPEADVRSLTFSMGAQSCSSDVLKVSGKVGRKYVGEDGEHLVDVADMTIAHDLAPRAASASATLALPSRAAGPVKVGSRRPARDEVPDPNMPDFAKALLGQVTEGSWEPQRPLTENEIHLWCECIEDWNPLYWDKEFAGRSRHGGIISPPASVLFGAGSSAAMGIGYMKPGGKIPAAVSEGLIGMPLLQALRKEMTAAASPVSPPGCPEIAITQARSEYFTPLRPGDTARSKRELLNCSPEKSTKLGKGYFATWRNSVHNQLGELVRTFTLTGFIYHT